MRTTPPVRPRIRLGAVTLALLLAGGALVGCGDDDADGTGGAAPTTTTGQTPGGTADLREVLRNPAAFEDKKVTVTGVADDVAPFVLTLSPAGATPAPTPATPTSPASPASPALPTAGTGTGTSSPTGTTASRLLVLHANADGPADGALITVTGTLEQGLDISAVEDLLNVDIDDETVRRLGLGSDFFLRADSLEFIAPTASPTSS